VATVRSPDARTPRQDEIVRVATRLFARDGYRAVGMRTIADAVGIRTSSLYHHFPSKQDLLYAISLDVTRDFIRAHAGVLTSDAPAAERLAAFVRGHVTYFAAHRLEQAVGRRELRELSAEHVAEVLSYQRTYQQRVERFFHEAVDSGEFRVADPSVAALAVLDMVNGIGGWYREGDRLSIDAIADLYVAMALGLVGHRAAGPGGPTA
jgi:AcrR family transcriptional regulator